MTATKTQRWMLALGLMLIVGLVGAAYVVTFQKDVLQHMARHLIAGSLGDRVTIRRIHVGLFPRPELTLKDVTVSEPDRDNPIFRASDIRLGISVFPVGQDAPTPNVLIIENAHFDLERDEHGQWNYQDILHDGSSGRLGALLSRSALELVNGSIDIEDRFRREAPVRVRAEAVKLQIERLGLEGATDVSLSARLSDRGTGALLSCYGTIEHLGGFLDFEPTEQPDVLPQLALHTRVELDRRTLLRAAEFFRVGDVPTGFRGHASAQGHVRFAPGVQGYDLVVSDLVVSTDVLDLHAEVSMAGLLHPDPPTLSSRWTSTPVAVQHLPHLIPRDWRSAELYQTIRRRILQGKIRAVSATFSGSAHRGLGYALGGEFHVSEGIVAFGPTWGTAEKVAGVIHVRPDRVQLSDFQGLYGHIPVTEGTGTIMLDEDAPRLTTQLAGVVSPTQVFDIVEKIFDWDAGDSSLPSLRGHTGQGAMTIRFGGPLRHPERIRFLSAEYRPEQVTLQLPGLRGLVTRVNGLLAFSPRQLRFENVSGVYGKSDVRIEGTMPFSKPSSVDEVRIEGHMHGRDIATLFPRLAVSEREVLSGAATYAVVVAGDVTTPNIRGTVDLQGLGIVVPGIMDKAPTLEGQLNFNVRVGENHQLSFKHVALTFPSVSLAGQGHVRHGHTPALDVSFTTAPVHFTALPPGLRLFDGAVSAGTLEVSLALRGTGRDWRSWHKSGWVALTKGTVTIGGMMPVSHVFLRAKLDGHTADLKHLQWMIGESRMRTTGVIRQWDSQPDMTLTVTSSQFDLARLIPGGRQSPLRRTVEHLARTATVSGNLQFDHAWYKQLSVRALTGRLRIRNSVIDIEAIQGTTDHGTIQGRVLAHLPVQQPATVKVWFDVHKMPLLALEHTFLEARTLDERLITGMVSAKGVLAGHGRDARGIIPTLTGNLQLSIVDGRVRRGTVVPKILTILNLPSLLQGQVDIQKDGYPFDQQTGTLTVANGRLASENIVMDGPVLKMTAAGQYDFIHDDLDVVAAVSPFGSYFDLLRKISLFGMLIDNDEQGVLSALFAVKGSLHAPHVTPMPLESLAFGVTRFGILAFNVLKNTITLPQKMFFYGEDTSQPASQPADSVDDDDEEF